jgi:hypothetical protein
MDQEKIIKLAQSYLEEHNKNAKYVYAARKTYFFTVNWNAPGASVAKVKQEDVPEAEKYNVDDVKRIFSLKNYPEPIIVSEETPRIEDEPKYTDIGDVSMYSEKTETSTPVTTLTTTTTSPVDELPDESSDIPVQEDEDSYNCYTSEINKKASLDEILEPSQLRKSIDSLPSNCSEKEKEKIYQHRKSYNDAQNKLLYYLKIEKKSLDRTEDMKSQRDEFQNNLAGLEKELLTNNLSQRKFIKALEGLEGLYLNRIKSRLRGLGNIGLNALKGLSLAQPVLPLKSDEMKNAIDHIKYRGLLDYWLRDDRELSPKKKF